MEYQSEWPRIVHRGYTVPGLVNGGGPRPRIFRGSSSRNEFGGPFQNIESYDRFSCPTLSYPNFSYNSRFRNRNTYDEAAESKWLIKPHAISTPKRGYSFHKSDSTWMPATEWQPLSRKDDTLIFNSSQQDGKQMYLQMNRECVKSNNSIIPPKLHSCGQLHHIAAGKRKKKHSINNNRGLFFCHACSMSFSPRSAFAGHMKSESHKSKQMLLEQLRLHKTIEISQQSKFQSQVSDKSLLLTTKQLPQQMFKDPKESEVDGNSLVVNEKKQYYCNVCKITFKGNVIKHRRTVEHKSNKAMARPFCAICNKFFRTPSKFVQHCKMPNHQEARKLNNKVVEDFNEDDSTKEKNGNELTDLSVESERLLMISEHVNTSSTVSQSPDRVLRNETANEPCEMIKDSEHSDQRRLAKSEETSVENEEKPEIDNGYQLIPLKESSRNDSLCMKTTSTVTPVTLPLHNVNVTEQYVKEAVGISFIIPVTGYFCKLCNEFFEESDKATFHCQSKKHHVNYNSI